MTSRPSSQLILRVVAAVLIVYLLWVNHIRHGSAAQRWILIIAGATALVWAIIILVQEKNQQGDPKNKKDVPQEFSAGGIVLNDRGQVIVVNQKHRSWSLPKGHIDPGETTEAAARREVMEETGLRDLQLVRKLGSFGRYVNNGRVYKTITIFLFHSPHRPLKPIDADNPEARWVAIDDVAQLLSFTEDRKFFLSVRGALVYTVNNKH